MQRCCDELHEKLIQRKNGPVLTEYFRLQQASSNDDDCKAPPNISPVVRLHRRRPAAHWKAASAKHTDRQRQLYRKAVSHRGLLDRNLAKSSRSPTTLYSQCAHAKALHSCTERQQLRLQYSINPRACRHLVGLLLLLQLLLPMSWPPGGTGRRYLSTRQAEPASLSSLSRPPGSTVVLSHYGRPGERGFCYKQLVSLCWRMGIVDCGYH